MSDGYRLGDGRRPEDVLGVVADLLRSEGIDPTWPELDTPRPAP